MTGAQQLEEVEPALRGGGAEPGEMVVADLGADRVVGPVPRAGVVDADPGGTLQAGPQYRLGLRTEAVLAADQKAHQLPLGDHHAQAGELLE